MNDGMDYAWQINGLADRVIDAHKRADDSLMVTLLDRDLRQAHIAQDVLVVVLSRLLPEQA